MRPSTRSSVSASAPLRLSLAGGGTDLPEWYRTRPAHLLAAAVNVRLCVHVAVGQACAAEAPLVNLLHDRVGRPLCVEAGCAISGGAGLGSSGALATALVAAESALVHASKTPMEVGLEAFRWERELLARPVGFQDHLTSALGSCVEMRVTESGTIEAWRRDDLADSLDHLLRSSVVVVETTERRDSTRLLDGLASRLGQSNTTTAGIATPDEVASAVAARDGAWLGEILLRHWKAKRDLNPKAATPAADLILRAAVDAGATGGKLIGAGGGGFVMIAGPATKRRDIERSCQTAGFTVRDLAVDRDGARLEGDYCG